MSYKILRPTTIINNTIVDDKKRFKVFAGGFINTGIPGNNGTQFLSAGLRVDFVNKQERMISAGLDPFRKELLIGYSFKITFRN